MRGRPNLYTDYKKESAIFSNSTQKFWFTLLIGTSVALVFFVSDYWMLLLTTAFLISIAAWGINCLLYTSPSPRDQRGSRMPSSA